MLHTRMGWGSRVVSSQCFCTKLWFMNMPVALESRSADVEMDASKVREVSSTWMLREQGEFLDRCQSLSQLVTGCVTCHTCHGCVTDFKPILGNPMEVTHVTSPGHIYVFPC